MQRPPDMSYRPTDEEKRAAAQAKEEKILSVQDRAESSTERLYRLFGARGALPLKTLMK
jgi:hypothetical protein